MRGAALLAFCWAVCAAAGRPGTDENSVHETLQKCSRYCQGGRRLGYLTGRSYIYEYHADTTSGVTGTDHRESRLHLSATAEILVASPCDFVLQLRKVVLQDSNPEDAGEHQLVPDHARFAEALSKHALSFSYHDGKVGELCPNTEDEPWILNIKRGVLSAFQTNLEDGRVYESDVAGVCETEYELSRPKFPLVVRRRKDLMACTSRQHHFLSLQSVSYNSPVDASNLPLVKSSHECKQNFGPKGYMERAVCTEVHLFRPYSNEGNGATTRIVQSLIYRETAAGHLDTQLDGSSKDVSRTTLLYQQSDKNNDAVTGAEIVAVEILEEVHIKTADGINKDMPRLFSQLVTVLRKVSFPNLLKLYVKFQNHPSRKFLFDAISLAGTSDSMTMMVMLYRSSMVSNSELDAWLTTLAFQKKPTRNMLAALSPLIDHKPPKQAILGVTSLVHSYCRIYPSCRDEFVVREVMGKVEHLLGNACISRDDEHSQDIVVALKGIGNAGVVVNSLDTLHKCYEEENNTVEIRLAAIDAFRRLSCQDVPRRQLLDAFINTKYDTELRIAAYLAAMSCPNSFTLRLVRDSLYNEDVNQVASFVWTHLTNLQETSSRWKQGIKDLLSNEFLRNKFNTDVRKFSRNYEASTYFDTLNAGAAVESNIIFTPKSYLPRSANLNLTIDLFGESFNVFEVGGRAEGFESAVEDIFGPQGYFPDQSVKKFMEKFRGKAEEDLENSIDKLASTFDAKSNLQKEPQASVYGRVFGNELLYSRFHGLQNGMDILGNKGYRQYLMKFAMGEHIDYNRSFSLVDASYVIPTIVGFPLEFAVNGSASVSVKTTGTVRKNRDSISLVGEIVPSAAVEITGTMTMDAFVIKTGVVSVNRLHTNTFLGGHLRVVQGKLVDVKIDVPREKMEVLDVSSRLFVLHRDGPVALDGIIKDREEMQGCTPELFSQVVGLKACGLLAYPNASLVENAPYFPLTGPFNLQLDLIKTDTFNAYEFNYKVQDTNQRDNKVNSVSVLFDTPGSKIDRKIQALGLYDRKKSAVSIDLKTPFVSVAASGLAAKDANGAQLEASLSVNDAKLVEVRAGVKQKLTRRGGSYEPTALLSYNGNTVLDLVGKIHFLNGVKYSADLSLKAPLEPILISGNLNILKDGYNLNGSMASSAIKGTIEGAGRKVSDYVSSHGRVQYAIQGGKEQTIELTNKMLMSTQGDAQLRNVQLSLKMSEFPAYNLDTKWELRRGAGLFSHSLAWTLGQSRWQTEQLLRYQVMRGHIDSQLVVSLFGEDRGVDYKIDAKFQTTGRSLSSHAIAHLGATHRYVASVEYMQDPSDALALNLELSYPGFNATLEGGLAELERGHFGGYLDASLDVSAVGSKRKGIRILKLVGSLLEKSNANKIDQAFSLVLNGELKASLSGAHMISENSATQWMQLRVAGETIREDLRYSHDNAHHIDASLTLGNNSYRGSAVVVDTDTETSVSLQLDFSTRITLMAKLLNESGIYFDTLETKVAWNEHINPSNKVYFVVKAGTNKSNIVLEYPGERIVTEIDSTSPNSTNVTILWGEGQKIAALLAWAARQTAGHATIQLETPFHGIKNQHVSGSYYFTETSAEVQGELVWQEERIAMAATGTNKNGNWMADLRITSTVSDAMLHLHHTHSPGKLASSARVSFGEDYTALSLSLGCNANITADLRLTSSQQLVPSLRGQLRYETTSAADTGYVELTWADVKKITGTIILRTKPKFSTLVQITTPFNGYETFSSELLYKLDSSNLHFEGYAGFNDQIVMMTIQGTSLNGSIEFTGNFVTRFAKPLHVGFSHNGWNANFKSGLAIQYDGKQVLMANSDISVYSLDNNDWISILVSFPGNTLKFNYKNKVNAENTLVSLGGAWNTKTLFFDIVGKVIETSESYSINYSHTLHGTVIAKRYAVNFCHQLTPKQRKTSLEIPEYISITNVLLTDDIYNWENKITIQTPLKTGTIFNVLSFNEENQEWMHRMTAEVGNKKAVAQISARIFPQTGLIREAQAELSTPWGDPVKLQYSLQVERSTIEPEIVLEYKRDKEIRIKTRVQLELIKSEVGFEMTAPYLEPIVIKATYDLSQPTQEALLRAEWDSVGVELRASAKLNTHHGSAYITATRSDEQAELMKIGLKYNVQGAEKFARVEGKLGDKELLVDIKAAKEDYKYSLNTNVNTPFTDWEKVTLEMCVDISQPIKMSSITIAKQNYTIQLSGNLIVNTNSSGLNFTSVSTFDMLPTISLTAFYDRKSSNNQLLATELNFNGAKSMLHFKLQHDNKNFIDAGLAEMYLKTPLKSFEQLNISLNYHNTKEHKQVMVFYIEKKDWKLQINGQSSFGSSGGDADIQLQLPFTDLPQVSAALKHRVISNIEQTLNIVLAYNDKNIEVDNSVISSGNELAATIEIKTPIAGYENLRADFGVTGIIHHEKTLSVALLTPKHTLRFSGLLNIDSLVKAFGNINVTTSSKTYKNINAGFKYDIVGSSGTKRYANTYLQLPSSRHEINIFVDNHEGRKATAEFSITSPMLNNIKITGDYNLSYETFVVSTRATLGDTNQVLSADVVIRKSMISAHIICPFLGFRELSLSGTKNYNATGMFVTLNIVKNDVELIKVITTANMQSMYVTEFQMDVQTPVQNWENIRIHSKFEFIRAEEVLMKLVAMKGEDAFEIAGSWTKDDNNEHGSLQVLLSTLGSLDINVNHISSVECSVTLTAQRMNGENIFNSSLVIADKNTSLLIQTHFKQLQTFNLSTHFDIYSTVKYVNLNFKYQGIGSELIPFKINLLSDSNRTILKVFSVPFSLFNEVTVSLGYRNMFKDPINSLISFSLSVNRSKIIKATLSLALDWKNKIGIDFKMHLRMYGNNKFNLYAWSEPKFPPNRVQMAVKYNTKTLIDFRSDTTNVRNGGFTYRLEVGSVFITSDVRTALAVEFYPHDILISVAANLTGSGVRDNYSAKLTFDEPSNNLQIYMSSPLKGYENIFFTWIHAKDSIEIEMKSPFTGYEHIQINGKLNVMQSNRKQVAFLVTQNERVTGMDMSYHYGENYAETSLTLMTPFESVKVFKFMSQYDLRESKNIAFVRLEINGDVYKMDGELLVGNMRAEGQMHVFTPMTDMKRMHLQVAFDLEQPSSKLITFSGEVNRVKKVELRFECHHTVQHRQLLLELHSPVSTTDVSFMATYNFSEGTHSAEAQAALMGVVGNATAKVEKLFTSGAVSASMVRGEKPSTARLIWDTQTEGGTKSAEASMQLEDGRKTLLTATINVANLKNLTTSLAYTSVSSEMYAVHAQWEAQADKLVGKLNIQWGEIKVIQLGTTTQLSPVGKSFMFTVNVGSSFKLIDEIMLKYDRDVTAESAFNSRLLKANHKVSFTASFMKPLELSMGYNLNFPNHTLNTTFVYGLRRFQIDVQCISDINPELSITIKTPIYGLSRIHFHGKLPLKQVTKGAELVLLLEDYAIRFRLDVVNTPSIGVSLTTSTKFLQKITYSQSKTSAMLDAQWNTDQYISAKVMYSNYELLELDANTSFVGYERISGNLVWQKDWNLKAQLHWGKQKLELYGHDTNVTNTYEVILATPWTQKCNLQITREDKEGKLYHVNLHHGKETYKIDTKLVWDINKPEFFFKLQSSLDTVSDMILSASFRSKDMEYKARIKYEFGTMKLYAFYNGTSNEPLARLGFKLLTPFKGIEDIYWDLNVNYNNGSGYCIALRNDSPYIIVYSKSFTDKHFTAWLYIRADNYHLSNSTVNIQFETDGAHWDIHALWDEVVSKGSYVANHSLLSLETTLSIPFVRSVKNVSLSVNIDPVQYIGSVKSKFGLDREIWIRASLLPENLMFNILTPAPGIRNVTLAASLISSQGIHKLTAGAHVGKFNVTIHGALQTFPGNYSICAQMNWSETGQFTLRGDLEVTDVHNYKEIASHLGLITSVKQMDHFDMKLSSQLIDDENTGYTFSLSTPFTYLPKLKSYLTLHEGKDQSRNARFTTSLLEKELTVEASLRKADTGDLQVTLNADIPFGNSTTPWRVEGKIVCEKWHNCNAGLQLQGPRTIHGITGMFKLAGKSLDAQIGLNTPRINSNVSFGASVKRPDNYQTVAEVYVGKNKASASYTLDKPSFNARLALNMPTLQLPEMGFNITGTMHGGTTNQGVFTYNYGKQTGKVEVKFEADGRGSTLAFAELDLPVFFGNTPHSTQFEIKFGKPSLVIEARYKGKSSSVAYLKFGNENNNLSVMAQITNPIIGDKKTSLIVKKNWELVTFHLADLISVELKMQSDSGFVTLSHQNKVHKLQYYIHLINGFEGNFHMESSLLSDKNLTAIVTYKNKDDHLQGKLNFESGLRLNSASLELRMGEQKMASVEVVSDNRILLAFDSSASVTKSNVQAEASLEVFGSVTNIAVRHHRGFPLDSEINVMSPLLPHMTARAILNTENGSMLAYAGHGNISNGQYVMLEAGVKRDIGKVYLNLKTPIFSAIKQFSFVGGFKSESRGLITASIASQFASDFVDSLEFASNYQLTSIALDASLKLKTPFIDHEVYEGNIHIPFIIRNSSNLNISITLPCNNYSFYTSLELEDHLQLGLLAKYGNKHIDANFEVEYSPKLSLVVKINTPFKGFNRYSLNLKGQRNVQDGNDIVNFIELDDKRIELRYSFVKETNKFLTRVELSTPFRGFDRYSMQVQYENENRKVAVATLYYPGLVRDVGIEFDYLFKGIFDINLVMKFNIPFIPKIGTAALYLANKLDVNEGTYKGMISGKFNEKESSLAVEGVINSEEMKMEIQAQLNDKDIYLEAINALRGNKLLFSLELRTPFPVINNVKAFAQYGPHEMQVAAIYNSKEIIGLDMFFDMYTCKVEFRNSVRPVAFTYSVELEDKISLNAEICWDLNHQIQSQFGVGTTLSRTGFASEIKLPTRILSASAVSEFTPLRTEYAMHFSWEEGKTIGYRLLTDAKTGNNYMNLTALARIDFPFRSFEGVFSIESDFQSNIKENIELFWDAADDRSKKVGLHIGVHNLSTELTFQHAFLDHDIIVRCIELSRSGMFAFGKKLIIIYSSKPEDEIMLGAHVTTLPTYLNTGFSVYHKTSKLGLEVSSEGFHGINGSGGKLNISYLESSSGQQKALSASGRVSYIQPEIELSVQTIQNHFRTRCSAWEKKNGYSGITFEFMMNQKAPLTTEAIFNMEDTSVELALGYGNMRQYHIQAQFPHWREVTAEAWHTLNGIKTQDGLASVRLNTTRLLWTTISWQPRFLNDVQQSVLQEYADIALVINAMAQDYLNFLSEDFFETFKLFSTSFTFKDFVTYSKSELCNIVNDFQTTGIDLVNMYERNDFFIKDLHNMIITIWPNFEDLVASLTRHLARAGEAVHQVIKSFISVLWEAFSMDRIAACITEIFNGIKILARKAVVHFTAVIKHLSHVQQAVAKATKKILEYTRWQMFLTREWFYNASAKLDTAFQLALEGLEKLTEPFMSKLEEYLMSIHDIIVDIELSFIVLIDTIADTLLSVKEVRELLQVLTDYGTWLEEFHLQEYIDVLIDMVSESMELLVSDIMNALRDLKTHISKITKPFVGQVDNMPVLLSIRSGIGDIYQKVAWLWRYHKISHRLLEGADYIMNQADDILLRLIDSLDTDSTDDTKANLVFRPDLGYIEYAHPLPFEWNGFNELPKIEQLNMSPLNKKSDKYLEKLDRYSYFFMHPIDSALNKSLVPPFTKQAVVAGGHHFITFDGQIYEFEGTECSYLLTSDFLDRKFSAIINYELQGKNVVKKSLTVITEGHHIDIGSSGWVTVDGKATELPIKVGTSVLVTRLGSRVVLHSKHGLNVECNVLHDVCTLELSGWHFGKTGGLLGTFDNEPSNDLSLPDASITTNIGFFTRSWRVGSSSSCQSTPDSIQEKDVMVTDKSKICKAYFQSDRSPLEPCFATINPKRYYDMCLSDGNSSCFAALLYIAQCKMDGIEIWAPNDCVMCLLDDGTVLRAGEDRMLEYSPSLADVVLVVEQGSCLKNARLIDAVAKLDTLMTEKGVTSTHFSVVSFAGAKFHQPHTHTVDGQIWTSRKGVEKAINSLEFDKIADEDSSVLDALHFAVQLPFRGGASRTIILVTCDECDQLADEADVQKMLNELKDTVITLHVLGPDVVQHDKSGRVYGMDATGTYSGRNLKSMMPSKIMLKQVSISKSLCMPLALGTNGTLFNLNSLTGASSSSRKFVDVWAHRVMLTALPEKCQKCECVSTSDHVGQMECIPCDNTDQMEDQFMSQEKETTLFSYEDEDKLLF